MRCSPVGDGPQVAAEVITSLPDTLRAAQRVFEATGGLHAAALFTPSGELIEVREDVGRHNALDKLVGAQLLAGSVPLADRLLMVSGRTASRSCRRRRWRASLWWAVSAPSSLAVEAARRFGMTLIGFLRGERFNVYAGAERVQR